MPVLCVAVVSIPAMVCLEIEPRLGHGEAAGFGSGVVGSRGVEWKHFTLMGRQRGSMCPPVVLVGWAKAAENTHIFCAPVCEHVNPDIALHHANLYQIQVAIRSK